MIYIDMDGVFVNFDLHFKKLHGVSPKELKGDDNDFWKIFDTKCDGFFRDCSPFDGHLDFLQDVLTIANEYDYGVEMLTAIPRRSTHPTAHQEKQDWMHLNGMSHIKMNIGPYAIDKQKWCTPGSILIDDTARNIAQWSAAGGTGIYHENFTKSLVILKDVVRKQ